MTPPANTPPRRLHDLRYRLQRAAVLAWRGLDSLRTRGLRATWRRLRSLFDASPATAARLRLHARPVGAEELAFASIDAPTASIVVPVYNQLGYTLRCLYALMHSGDVAAFEVIVVDDASQDGSGEALAKIPGLRLLRNSRNLGFIGACNAGAAAARGEFLVFLNNDTCVQPGWLDALLATFAQHPDTGLAGSKLVYPDGRLQEAGGLVFADGSAWNYGRFDDPAHPQYNFVRETDYCSGAAIALPRTLFEQLHGFDPHYAPAYYEDTDLALRVRRAGRKVRYQPASLVAHYEGISSGTDINHGIKAHQAVNQQKFLRRWQAELALRQPPPALRDRIADAVAYRHRHRVLVLDALTPMPDRDSGSVRMRALLRLLCEEGCSVDFFAENRMHDGAYSEALQQLGVRVWWHPWIADVPAWLREHGPRLDLVIASRHYVLAPLLPLLRDYAPNARIVFDTVDLHFLREQREAELANDPALQRIAARTRDSELSLVRRSDLTWVVSPHEQSLLRQLAPEARVQVLSNIHAVHARTPGFAKRRDIAFVGSFRHPPNVDAARWLAEEIFPRVRARDSEIHLHLIGGGALDEVAAYGQRPGIVFHGQVSDLDPLLDEMRLNLAPLRYGAGIKGKINHSLARGLPTVATSCAIEGMHLSPDADVLVADDANTFADAVLKLYSDEPLWLRLRAGGIETAHRHFSPAAARATLKGLLAELPAHG
jgi:GT2 family glycosyltransferase